MSTKKILLGRQACGCITRIDCEPSHMTARDRADIGKFVAAGGEIVHVDSVDEARAMPHFMVMECPHDPVGWGKKKGEPNQNRQTTLEGTA